MQLKKTIILISATAVLTASSSVITARDYTTVDFDKGMGYKSIGVYDTWEQSPFRTGALKGNYAVVSGSAIKGQGNYSVPEHVLGAQRSRFGSNTFGARVNLTDSFMLTPEYKYVHVIMNRPVSGRVMLVGIGGSSYFPSNGNDVEQFWETSLNNVRPNQWTDAVFAVKGFSNSSVNSLVLVPECESPHNRTEDFPFYIASIVVNDSPKPLINYENYTISAGSRFDTLELDNSSITDRTLRAITITTGYGTDTITIDQATDRLLFRELLDDCVTAKPGDIISIAVDYSAPSEMDAYVFVDWNSDGIFNYGLLDNGVPDEISEVMSYSFGNNRNSDGNILLDRPSQISLPPFTIPADIRPGVYRMRINIDNNCVDPAGSDIIGKFGGSITDIMLNVHGEKITINDNQLNGEVLANNESKLNNYPAVLGEDFPITIAPEKGFRSGGVTVRYGNLQGDSIVMENPQYFEKEFKFTNRTFVVPGKYTRGDVLVMGRMIEQNRK